MKMHRNEKGITLGGFVILLCVAGFFAYLAMRLVPMYIEYFGVVKAMDQVRTEGTSSSKTLDQIRRDLRFKFDTEYVSNEDVPPSAITMKRDAGAATLRITYEKRVPFLYNLDIIGTFDKSVNLTAAGGE
jgi:hypothetical protein